MREEVETHSLRDRFGSRAYHLHIIESYEGQLKLDELINGVGGSGKILGCN